MKLISYLYLAGGIFCGIVANGYFLKISEGFTKIISMWAWLGLP